MARESKNGGSVKSKAAAIQSSGRRGMLVSLLIGLLLLLMLATGRDAALRRPVGAARRLYLKQTQSAQAGVKMHLPKGRRNFNTRNAKAVRLPCTFSLDHPQREL